MDIKVNAMVCTLGEAFLRQLFCKSVVLMKLKVVFDNIVRYNIVTMRQQICEVQVKKYFLKSRFLIYLS